ncbi:hypothetical protein HDU87_002240 [Geranomyces variabilis]|uniref:Tyrosyl-DNA phosphodiesterase 1 n=1 Tax=Geranomyces variabilis TaxID=109894 RepID=A0AAD5XTB9_9FUNG|nr:hypothetical protein HDU87_002240 [Geranomyces variabilis]
MTDWTCDACTYINPVAGRELSLACDVCATPKPHSPSAPAGQEEDDDDDVGGILSDSSGESDQDEDLKTALLLSLQPADVSVVEEGEQLAEDVLPVQSSVPAQPSRAELERQRLERLALKRLAPESSPLPPLKKPTLAYPMKYAEGTTMLTYLPGHSRVGYARFEDLVNQSALQRAVLSSFQLDYDWIGAKFPNDIKLAILCPRFSDLPPDKKQLADGNTLYIFPPMGLQGCMHAKFLLLFYPSFLRVVITSANLTDYDWERLENVLWVQDFILHKDPPQPSRFGEDLVNVLTQMTVPDSIIRAVRNADFAPCGATLVFSRPGTHKGADLLRYGHPALAEAVRNLKISDFPREDTTREQFASPIWAQM